MLTKLRNSYQNAHEWAHHHTVVTALGLLIFGVMVSWQLLMPQLDTQAAYSPTWCSENSGFIDIPYSQCEALADLYNNTDGANWINQDGWFTDTNVCNGREQIGCNYGDIYSLSLDGNGLAGTLPQSIGDLTGLTHLSLASNNLYGEIPSSLSSLENLQTMHLRSNEFGGDFLQDLSNMTNLRSISISHNPDLTIDLDVLADVVDTLTYLDIGFHEAMIGDLGVLGNMSLLESLYIEEVPYDGDINEIRWSIQNLSALTNLKLKRLHLSGELPNIRFYLSNLTELSLQFNDMTGPIPPSFAALSNLESLVLSFNNFDGPTPEYIASLPINDEGDISTNCFETQGVPLPVATALDNKFPGWTSQYNCRANIVLEGQLEAQLTPGSCTNYQITYENIGPQVAKNVKIGQLFGPQITVQSSIPSYATGTVGATYGTMQDSCYAQAAQDATGPYYQAMEQVLQANYGATSLWEMAVNGLGFTGAQYTTEFAYTMDTACPMLFGTEDKAICFLMFGLDMSEIDPSCGAGGSDGYLRYLNDLEDAATGTIDVNICLAANATGPIAFTTLITTISNNENENGGEELFEFTIDEEVEEEETPPSSGGGGGGGAVVADNCPYGDYTDSYYDSDCGDGPILPQIGGDNESNELHPTAGDETNTLPSEDEIQAEREKLPKSLSIDSEYIAAYLWAKKLGMTTSDHFMSFDYNGVLTRATAAKFFVQYLEQVLGKTADESRRTICSQFDDIEELKRQDLYEFVIRSCMHEIMGLDKGKGILQSFMPHELVTRDQQVTMLSRVLDGTTFDNQDGRYPTWYGGHMQNLLAKGMITNTEPTLIEKRIYPLLMFLRRERDK